MPPPFQDLDPRANPPDFERLLYRFPFERKLTSIHIHRWRLRENQWRGHRSLKTIWYMQTRQLGWSDIAQHLTIAPEGCVWTGRDWNRPPCSVSGANGTRKEGPFMVTLVGDFDEVDQPCSARQYEQLVNVVARIQRQCKLPPEAFQFCCELEPAPASGSSAASRATLVEAITKRSLELAEQEKLKSAARAPASKQPFGEQAEAWYQFITICNQHRRKLRDEPENVPQALNEPVPRVATP